MVTSPFIAQLVDNTGNWCLLVSFRWPHFGILFVHLTLEPDCIAEKTALAKQRGSDDQCIRYFFPTLLFS